VLAERRWREMCADEVLRALPPEQFVAGLSEDR
jgi:hypothetical protein